jgi:MFS family permease
MDCSCVHINIHGYDNFRICDIESNEPLGFSVIFARLSDVTGRMGAVMLAFLIFTVFSLACGLARTLIQLIVFRALQGIGGSGLYSMTMVVFPEISPPKVYPIMSGVIGAVIAIGGVLGPVLGGLITHYSTWRWIFLLK